MTMMTRKRALKLLLSASTLALFSAVVGASHRPHPHKSYHHLFFDDGPRWRHVPHRHRHHRHVCGRGGHHSPPFYHQRHRR